MAGFKSPSAGVTGSSNIQPSQERLQWRGSCQTICWSAPSKAFFVKPVWRSRARMDKSEPVQTPVGFVAARAPNCTVAMATAAPAETERERQSRIEELIE